MTEIIRPPEGGFRTDRPRVIPFPNGAMHIDGGEGRTLCGFAIAAFDNVRFPAEPGARVSCARCWKAAQ